MSEVCILVILAPYSQIGTKGFIFSTESAIAGL